LILLTCGSPPLGTIISNELVPFKFDFSSYFV